MSMKILALDGLSDSKLCKLVSSLIQTIDGIEYANIDYLSQKLTLQMKGRDSAKIIAKVSTVLKENMPGVTIKLTQVSEFDEKRSEVKKPEVKKPQEKSAQDKSGMSLTLAKAISTMMSEETQAPTKAKAEAKATDDPMVKRIVDEPVIEILQREEEPEEKAPELDIKQANEHQETEKDAQNDDVENDVDEPKGDEESGEDGEPLDEAQKQESLFERLKQRFGMEMLISFGSVAAGFVIFCISLLFDQSSVASYVMSIISLIIFAIFALLIDNGKYKSTSLAASLITVATSVLAFFLGHRNVACISLFIYHLTVTGVYLAYEHFYDSMDKSLDIKPKTLKKVTDGKIEVVNFEDIWSGDEVMLDKEDTVPFDSVIVEGESVIDDSLISGRADPVSVKAGAFLNCGSKIKGDSVKIAMIGLQENSIAAVAKETIRKDNAQYTKATNQAQKFSLLCVIAQIILILGFSGVMLLTNNVGRLVEALPAAVLLLSPVGIIAGVKAMQHGALGKALKNGIVLVSSSVLEEIATTKTIVTGCGGILTKKECKVYSLDADPDCDIEDLVQAAAYAESKLEHPISTAVIEYYTSEYNKQVIGSHVAFCESFQNGVRAMAEARMISVGGSAFMEKSDIEVPINEKGKLCIYVAKYGEYMGTIFLKEEKRDGAESFVRSLKGLGFERVVLLTARDESVARAIGQRAGFEEIRAECDSSKKLAVMSEVMRTDYGNGVLFAGEVDDCERFSDFCSCIAMGEGSFASMLYAAKMIIPSGEIKKLIKAFRICKGTQTACMVSAIGSVAVKAVAVILAMLSIIPFPIAMLINAVLMLYEVLSADFNLHT